MIIIGFLFLAVYIQSQNTETISVLSHPSYYVERSLLMMFLAGIAVLVFSVLGSFFSWFKILDKKKEEELVNPGYASEAEIHNWVDGSSADSIREESIAKGTHRKQAASEHKESLSGASKPTLSTELIGEPAVAELNPEKTEIIEEENKA